MMNERVSNNDAYPSTSRYKNLRQYRRDIRKSVVRVEQESWDPPSIPDEVMTKMTKVLPGEEGALDLISERVYGTDKLWWVLAIANDILDPFNETVSGLELKYPPFSYVSSVILV